ncbi:MAG TPA: hypothetical protein VLA56_04360 [Pseudomonadales bacterium]|nr:hypothetical protein [Pseudomonadales bacterium]
MLQLLCWNRVRDYDRWRAVFDSHGDAHQDSGLSLVCMWREQGAPDSVHFLFDVTDEGRARAFLEAPESAQAGLDSGVLEGAFAFVEPLPGGSGRGSGP